MKVSKIKKLMLAVSGFVAFQAAGCNFLEQLQSLLPEFPSFGI